MKLSPQQLEHFNREGFAVVENALHHDDLAPVIQGYGEYIDRRARELQAQGQLSQLYEHEPFERRLTRICEEYPEIITEMDIMNSRVKGAFDFLRNDNLLDLVESLLGPEITCSPIQHVRPKLPSQVQYRGKAEAAEAEAARQRLEALARGYEAPWHQDAQVHLEDADATLILTVWLPLCDATPESGCLQIIPGAHKQNIVYWSHGFGISADHMPAGEVVTLPMKKGSVLLMHKLIPHGSGPNNSDGIRWSMDLRYQRTGTPTGRSYYPDFVARSRANPQSVLTDHEEWCRRWIAALEKSPAIQNQTRPESPTPLQEALR